MSEIQQKEYPSVQEMTDDQRIKIVKDIFASVTDKYDFLNRFLSGRRDIAWRKRTIMEMEFLNTHRFLDIATGTGDLALDCAKTYPEVKVTGGDFVQGMVDKGMEKVSDQNLLDKVKLKWGDATNLEFEDDSRSEYIVHVFQVDRFVLASKLLHHEPGVNPHNKKITSKIIRITLGEPSVDGPYWWTTPDLQNNNDTKNGAMVYDFGHWRTIWETPKI